MAFIYYKDFVILAEDLKSPCIGTLFWHCVFPIIHWGKGLIKRELKDAKHKEVIEKFFFSLETEDYTCIVNW